MTRTAQPTHSPRPAQSSGIVRWLFLKGTKLVVCEIRSDCRRVHDVCVVPQWNVASSVVERYGRAADAFQRHAEIASSLRDAGWMIVRDGAPGRVGAAA
jgi:hypothetical protein